MDNGYRTFFGLKNEPFRSDLSHKEILETDALKSVKNRFDYAVRLGSTALVTGEIGSGKSTAIRYCLQQLHPSEYKSFYVTATSGSILELYRQITSEMGINQSSNSRAVMTRLIQKETAEIIDGKKMKVVLVVDEASLLRLEVFAELHTLCQFHSDSKPWLPMILIGQSSLIDKLMYRSSAPLASRIVARSHLEGLDRQAMQQYLEHHLSLSGVENNLFENAAITAIHQGSGGLLRKANHLARGALIAATRDKCMTVNAEHVRVASTEIF
jgi:type II secretory pathway predicted ATPase ExeA